MLIYKTQRQFIDKFAGYNALHSASFNEFSAMKNLSGEDFPFLRTRDRRSLIKSYTKINALGSLNGIYLVDGTNFVYNGNIKASVADSPKQVVNSGAEVIIYPDKKLFNTNNNEFLDLENKFEQSTTATYSISKPDGSQYTSTTTSMNPPSNPSSGDVWIDTSGEYDVMKIYSGESELWNAIGSTHIKISCTGIGVGFKQFDGITVSGCSEVKLNGDYVIQDVAADYIILYGLIRTQFTQASGLVIERKAPDLDFLTVYNNRVWGCSSENHEVYSAKLGDPKNWYAFEGISTDSYIATIASSGNFTGAITFGGFVMFFKEDTIHRVYGNKPSNFEISELKVAGVKSGCDKSLAIVNGALYYLSVNGVMRYEGGMPEVVSRKLGNTDRYSNAVGGSFGDFYYLSVQEPSGEWKLLIYDTVRRMWHVQDDTQMQYTVYHNDNMYFIADNKMFSVKHEDGKEEDVFEWEGISGIFGLDTPDGKYVGKLQLRVDVAYGERFPYQEESRFNLDIEYNSEGRWTNMVQLISESMRSYTMPIPIRRCDHFRIRIHGKGDFRLYSIALEIFDGGDYAATTRRT